MLSALGFGVGRHEWSFEEFRVELRMVEWRVEYERFGTSNSISTVKVESLSNNQKRFLPFEEERASTTDLGIGRVSNMIVSAATPVPRQSAADSL